MTSGRCLTVHNVLFVSSLRRNLVSESNLLKLGYNIVKEENKFVINKNDVFMAKGFVIDGLFTLNVMNSADNDNCSSMIFNIESCDLWHGRLGNVKFWTIRRMVNLNMIPKTNYINNSKC